MTYLILRTVVGLAWIGSGLLFGFTGAVGDFLFLGTSTAFFVLVGVMLLIPRLSVNGAAASVPTGILFAILLNNLVADSAQPTLAASIAPAYFVTLAVVGVVLVVVGCRETAPATTPRFH